MKLLLDTCTFLWMTDRSDLLSEPARQNIENASHELLFHQVSFWEIQLKYTLGKLPLKLPPREFVPMAMERHGINNQNLEDEVIWFLDKLPPVHGDPFDRVLIAHALSHGLTIVTPDTNIHKYPVPVLW